MADEHLIVVLHQLDMGYDDTQLFKSNVKMCVYLTCIHLAALSLPQKSNQPMGKPEVTIDLRDAEIKFGNDADVGRKNVLTVSIVQVSTSLNINCFMNTTMSVPYLIRSK